MGHISPAEKTDHYKRVLDQRGCIQKDENAVSKGLSRLDIKALLIFLLLQKKLGQ